MRPKEQLPGSAGTRDASSVNPACVFGFVHFVQVDRLCEGASRHHPLTDPLGDVVKTLLIQSIVRGT